ncbi:hypothetical protein BC332_26081 [Capsicum chinense]|nr:hypothetical protein BC332_26081 [Capsicum chinense]
MMDGKCTLGSPKIKVERALERNGLLRIPVQKLRDSRRIKHGVIQMFLIYRECAKILNQDRVLDITVSPGRKNAWDWSTRAASAHPKKTSPVAADNKPKTKDGQSARKEWNPLNSSTKDWEKQNTKTWGHLDVFDISGVHKNVGSGWASRYNWYAPNDPRKHTMPQLHDGGFPSPAAVSPAWKNVGD